MAAYLNRTISLMTGNGTEPSSPGHDNATALLDRSLRNNTSYENSPLQIFVKAKKKINDIFGEIEEYVVETARFMDGKNKYKFNANVTFNNIGYHLLFFLFLHINRSF